ncbi:MAG: AraC family transcriptional regulator ligand-binding domain-containing protein [Pseudomonadales bacterium]
MDTPFYCSTAYVQLFLRSAQIPEAKAFAGTSLSDVELQNLDYIDARDFALILQNVDRANSGTAWAARTGIQLSTGTHGPMGFAALSAPTLGAAMQVLVDFHGIRITSLEAKLERGEKQVRVIVNDLTSNDQYGRWIAESVLRVIQSLIEVIIGYPVGENVVVSFGYSQPSYAPELISIYGSRCEFDAEHCAIAFPSSWWEIHSPLYDESVYRMNIAKCREILASLSIGRDPVHQVRNLLARHFDEMLAGTNSQELPPSSEQLAKSMHVTSRTLIRHLKQGGSSYKALLEAERIRYAENILLNTHLTVAEVGFKLGYSEPANFGRAFRAWHGTSPAAWRRQNSPQR